MANCWPVFFSLRFVSSYCIFLLSGNNVFKYMGMFDQFKAAQNMMKNMSPDQIRELMEQAKESQAMLNKEIKKVVEEEIARRNLVSREEVLRLIKEGR